MRRVKENYIFVALEGGDVGEAVADKGLVKILALAPMIGLPRSDNVDTGSLCIAHALIRYCFIRKLVLLVAKRLDFLLLAYALFSFCPSFFITAVLDRIRTLDRDCRDRGGRVRPDTTAHGGRRHWIGM